MPDTAHKESFLPGEGLSYDPSEEKYWNDSLLRQEIDRTFQICHSCRMCFKYCDAFPTLFSFIDNNHNGEVKKITDQEVEQVVDYCFQCKLCEVQCPYTRREGHEYQLDFPALISRYEACRTKKKGVSFRSRLLGNPDGLGKLGRLSFGLANLANRIKINRWFMEKFLGIHREKLLPDFALSTFESWANKTGRIAKDHEEIEAILFQTCFIQNNEPEIGRDAIEVLEKNNVKIKCVKGLQCCGMPAWEHGDLNSLRRQAKNNLKLLIPFVEKGAKVLVINPTCSMMMRREYPEILDPGDKPAAKKLAEAIMDVSEFLWSIRNEERFCSEVQSRPNGKIAYHAPCHLRAQAVGFKGKDLVRKLFDINPAVVTECCGHNGTYAMTVKGFEPSKRIGKKAFDGMKQSDADLWMTDCPLAAIQFKQHAGKEPMHPVSVLAKAYRGESFIEKD